jgi:hypothetical protein
MPAETTSASLFVGPKAAQTNYYADMQAARLGLPINVRVTINFSLLEISPEKATSIFRKMRSSRFAKWVSRPRRGCGPAAPATDYHGFENKRGEEVYRQIGPSLPHNVHVHWSMHIPTGRRKDFEGELYRWVNEMAGRKEWPALALEVEALTFGQPAKYLNKGARLHDARRYGANPDKIAEQGLIIGRRTGTSRNIGPARRRADDAARGIDRRKTVFRPRGC